MAVLIALLLIFLCGGIGSLAIMAYATRGSEVQPYDTVPYVETPGDLSVMDTLMSDYEAGGGCE